jgi:6-phosphogluconate dehydrogenase
MLTALPQKNTFLISTSAEICEKKNKQGQYVLAEVQDKVVQDVDNEEGTGVWSNEEAVSKHIPAPTLSTAHFLRIVSADRAQREHVKSTFHGSFLPSKIEIRDEKEREAFTENLRWAVYTACLAPFVQGMCIIDAADQQYKWSIDYGTVVQIWRAGCIIRADHIADLLDSVFSSSHSVEGRNLLYDRNIVNEWKPA